MDEEPLRSESTVPVAGFSYPEKLELPHKIGPYAIESLLQKGGMSVLYLGTDPISGQLAAIKVLSPRYALNREMVERFFCEAEIVALADHPQIVKMYGSGEWEGGLYIAMEFVVGVSLRHYILHTPISLKKALEIVLHVSYALCHLHSHGIIHRDLKPENILVSELGQIKVIDFGIAQLLSDSKSEALLSSRTMGTPIYMSPEQCKNPELVSYPSDIYSLGIIAYELVLGRLSYGNVYLSLMPKGMQKILQKTLQPKTEDRYQDIVDFISDLSSYFHSAQIEKDKQLHDQVANLFESFCVVQTRLTSSVPTWPKVEVAVGFSRLPELRGRFLHFIDFSPTSHVLFLGQSTAPLAAGVFSAAMLQGALPWLIKDVCHPTDLPKRINAWLFEENLAEALPACFFCMDSSLEHFQWISCGLASLWVLSADGKAKLLYQLAYPPLGTSLDASWPCFSHIWDPLDQLLLLSKTADEQLEQIIVQVAEQYRHLPLQKKIDAILRKVSLFCPADELLALSIVGFGKKN